MTTSQTTQLRTVLAAMLVPLVLAACARSGAQEFDVSGQVVPEEAPGPVAADLAGEWTYNPRQSDRPGQAMRGGGMPTGGGMGGPGGMGGMGGRGGRPGAGGMPPAGGQPGAGGGPGNEAMAAAPRLVIVQTDSSITITRANARALTLFFDGRAVWVTGRMPDEQVEMNARWRGQRLEVRRVISDRRSSVESYELSPNGRKLYVRVRMPAVEGETRMPELRRVYDRDAPPGR
jgi:hypothetical protein